MNIKLMLIIILASLAVIFIVQNVATVEIVFLYWRISISSSLLIFFTSLLGFFLGWYLHSYVLYRRFKVDSVFLR